MEDFFDSIKGILAPAVMFLVFLGPALLKRKKASDGKSQRKPPRDPESWVTAAAGSWYVGIDNLSDVRPWLSDSICRAVTGDGDVRRKLYTDGELAVFAFRRCVCLNGIDLGATSNMVLDPPPPDMIDNRMLLEKNKAAMTVVARVSKLAAARPAISPPMPPPPPPMPKAPPSDRWSSTRPTIAAANII